MATNGDPSPLATSETTLEIICALHDLQGARLMEVAEHLDRPPSTLYAHLETLRELRFVVVEDGRYDLGPLFVQFGTYAKHRKPAYERVPEYTAQLQAATGLRTLFLVEEYDRGYILHAEEGDSPGYRHQRPGHQRPLHATAAGKAILAEFPETRLTEYVDTWELKSFTEHTVSEPSALLAELERVRERGVAFEREENIEDLHAVGAAVTGADGEVLGALSVSGPAAALSGDHFEVEIPEALTRVAHEFELELSLS
jgi:DNA-binding IclR family transcriptional regulator